MTKLTDLCQPGAVRQLLCSWTDMHVLPNSYPLTLEAAQEHANAFMRAATREGISQYEIQEAIRGSDLRNVMVVKMRDSVEGAMSKTARQQPSPTL